MSATTKVQKIKFDGKHLIRNRLFEITSKCLNKIGTRLTESQSCILVELLRVDAGLVALRVER